MIGFQLQTAVMLGELPVVDIPWHLGIGRPFAKKFTFPVLDTFAVITTGASFFIEPEKVIDETAPFEIVQLKITTPPTPAPPAVDVEPVATPFVADVPL